MQTVNIGAALDESRHIRLDLMLANMRENAPVVEKHPHAGEYKGSCAGRAGIVVGAGPGIERNCALLREHGDAVVFVCDRGRDRLVSLGVTPDFVVTTDPSAATASFFAGPGIERETLLASTYTPKETLALPWKQVVFYNTQDKDPDYMAEARRICGRAAFIPGGFIVSNFAFALADLMGCRPVCFAGVDLSAPEPEPGWEDTENYLLLELTDGRRFHTLKSFLLSLEWIDGYVAHRRREERGFEAFNCTEGGMLYSDNIKGMPLADFLQVCSR